MLPSRYLSSRCQRPLHPLCFVRHHSTSSPRPLKLAIIGAGPSGFYSASRILSSLPTSFPQGRDAVVHMYERLPTPYGLVRYGVAPDHPEVKNCQHKFDELAHDPRFTFLGNISIGTQPSSTLSTPSSPSPLTTLSSYTYPDALHLPLSSIRTHYNTILLTYGASLSNPLSSVSGSTSSTNPLKGVFPALAFVSWYNGHPAFSHLPPNLEDVEDVSIIGHGNVALDVARILLKSASSLAHTDLPESVLEVLSRSKVKRVTAVGRRGPGQVAFTPKEFREMINLPDVSFSGVDPGLVEQAKGMVEGDRMRKRLLGLMEKTTSGAGTKEFRLDFLKSPTAFVPSTEQPGRVGEVEWEINDLLAPPPAPPDPPASQDQSIPKPAVVARPTGKRVSTKADMMIESVGYRSEPLGMGEEGWELPFDIGRGRVRNVGGRVVEEGGIAVSGMYAAGWAARGPVGVIASTMHDAYSLSSLILEDHFATPPPASVASPLNTMPEAGLPEEVEVARKQGSVVDLAGWGRIDEAERERARRRGGGKEREKFTTVREMLAVLA